MTTTRCPSCQAAVPPDAPWCGLCFADLRPKPVEAAPAAATAPAPEPQPAPQPASQPASQHAYAASVPAAPLVAAPAWDPLTSPLPPAEPTPAPAAEDPPIVKSADIRLAPPAWPCAACGTTVSLAHDACPTCGAGFMGGPTGSIPWEMPVVGDISKFSTGQKWAFAGIGAVVLSAVLWLFFYVVGSFL